MTEKGGEGLSHPTHTFCFHFEELGIGSPYLPRARESFQGRFPTWSDSLKQGLRGRWKASHSSSSRTSASPTRVLSPWRPPSEKARINLPQAPFTSFIIPFLPGLWNPFPVRQLLWLRTACGIMPKYLRLKPFTSDWDSNSQDRDTNPVQTHGSPTEVTDLLSGPSEAQVLTVLWQKEFSERQSEKEWFYSERNALHRVCCRGCCRGRVQPQNVVWLVFMLLLFSH